MSWLARPGPKHLQLFARNHMRIERHGPGVAIVTQDKVFPSIPAHFHSFSHHAGAPDTLQNRIRPKTSGRFADGLNPRGRRFKLIKVDHMVRAEPLRVFESLLWSADHDHLPC